MVYLQFRAQYRRYNEEQSLQLMDLTFRIRIRCLLIIGEVNGVLQE